MTLDRVYRMLLYCYPSEFRDEYGGQMVHVYRQRARTESRGALWLSLLWDVLRSAPKERAGQVWADLVYAVRTLRKTPAVTAAVLVTLALAIGANTVMFSVVNTVLLDPLPYPRADRLVRIWETQQKLGSGVFSVSIPNYVSWRERTQAFSEMACWGTSGVNLEVRGEPERIVAASVSGSLFHLLGYRPLLGRGISDNDEKPGTPPVIVLSRRLWSSRYASDPKIVGQNVTYGGASVQVVGVVENDGVIFDGVDAFAAQKINLANDLRNNHFLRVMGRLRDGVTPAQALAELKTVAAGMEKEFPDTNAGWGVRTVAAFDWIVPEEVRRGLLILLAAVGMVLLIACANIANLLLARSAGRRQEMAVRVALGAGRGRLVRLLLTESVLLATLGGVAGALLAYWGVAALRGVLPRNWARSGAVDLSTTELLFSLGISILTGLLFGLLPARQAARTDVTDALKSGGRGSTGGARRMRQALVALQVMLATALVAGAALFLQSLWNLQHKRMGFAPDHLLVTRLGFPSANYPDDAKRWDLTRRVLEDARRLPGVIAASAASAVPLDGSPNWGEGVFAAGPSAMPPNEAFSTQMRAVEDSFFQTMKIPLLSGATFSARDASGPLAVVVSEAVVRKLWPGENAVGRQLLLRGKTPLNIVGVATDVRNIRLDREPELTVYLPASRFAPLSMTLVLRTQGDPLSVAPALRQVVRGADSRVPLVALRSMDQILDDSASEARWNSLLIGGFAALALVLAAVGIYGVLAYAVALRRREIGVRMSLGASAGSVLRMIVREGMLLASLGVAAGVALALGKLAEGLLHDIKPTDSTTLAIVSVTLLLVALAASAIPALRAARVDPIAILRAE